MAENLRTTVLADGSKIPMIQDQNAWAKIPDQQDKIFCCYVNNDSVSKTKVLYTYGGAMQGSQFDNNVHDICPDGWNLSSQEDWGELIEKLRSDGFNGKEGTVLKAKTGWQLAENNEDIYGFNGEADGIRNPTYGNFSDSSTHGIWWSTSLNIGKGTSTAFQLYYNYPSHTLDQWPLSSGLSVRCIKN
jgi:uncharacterized protein (TIGR02145 family)